MSALTVEELEDRFLHLASPILDEFEGKIQTLFDEKFSEFMKQLESKTRGATSGFHKEKLSSLMDKLVGRMIIIKDNFISQLTAKINRAIVEAEDGAELSDLMMTSFIEEHSNSAMDGCITLFKEESTQVIIEGLGELSLDDSVEPSHDDEYNSMSEDNVDPNSEVEDSIDTSETKSEQTEDSEVPLRIPTGEKDKKKRKSMNLASKIRKKASKANSGSYRPVPGMK